MSATSDIHTLSGAYSVDALDDAERVAFERHVEACAECRTEVASLREAAGRLADVVARAPRSELRESVLAAIRTVRPLPPVAPTAAPRTAEPAAPPSGDVVPLPSRRARRWLPALVAAAVLAVVGVGLGVTQPWEPDQVEVSVIDQVLQAGDAERVTATVDGATVAIVRSRSHGKAVVQTQDMPAAPPGKVYELWLQTPDGAMEPAGLMGEGPDQTVLLEGDATDATAVGITVEPEGGSPRPTSDPIAVVELERA